MIINAQPPLHLTYCLNIHPGETWSENFASIKNQASKVKMAVAPDRKFGLGLRLSAEAAEELRQKEALEKFKSYLLDEDMYVFTINGFPYGRFHGRPVKESVYQPDWRTEERVEYTFLLAEILAELLPQGVKGSVSTVPGSYRQWIDSPEKRRRISENLADVAFRLRGILLETGREINLGLEPEPDCLLANTEDALRFFRQDVFEFGVDHLKRKFKLSKTDAEEIQRDHLGICLDTAHFQVAFEKPAEALRKIVAAGVTVSKIQLSAALLLKPTPEALKKLSAFSDPVYLHQVGAMTNDGGIVSHPDLPEALASAEKGEANGHLEWRVHFHVPLFERDYGELRSGADELDEEFFRVVVQIPGPPHLEIETYTFGVLPSEIRPKSMVESIVKECEWVEAKFPPRRL